MSSIVPIPVYNETRALYDTFISTIKPLLPMHRFEDPANFGQHVIKPSQLAEVLNAELEEDITLLAAMRGPIYSQDGRILALSIGQDGPISVFQFELELEQVRKKNNEKFKQVQEAVTLANESIKTLAAKHGLTAVDLYSEINRRYTLSKKTS